jgi:ubiquinone/menaquinone biosynthesis C-methylase UbiE
MTEMAKVASRAVAIDIDRNMLDVARHRLTDAV